MVGLLHPLPEPDVQSIDEPRNIVLYHWKTRMAVIPEPLEQQYGCHAHDHEHQSSQEQRIQESQSNHVVRSVIPWSTRQEQALTLEHVQPSFAESLSGSILLFNSPIYGMFALAVCCS